MARVNQALISQAWRGRSMERMLHRRDAAGGEMEMLARIMNDPKPEPEAVTGYIHQLRRDGHIPPEDAVALLSTVPHDPEALRGWARTVFAVVMHQGIHAHAAFPVELFPRKTPADDSDTEAGS